MADEYAYLEPDFDASSLTVPRLRSILVAHNVAYPSSAKKSDLVALFDENVAPQAKKLRSAQSKTKRSARGIEDVPSGQSSVVGHDSSEDDNLAPLETPARRTSRRSTRAVTEDAVSATPRATRSGRQSTAPPSTAKRAAARSVPIEEPEPEESPKKLAPRRATRQSVSPGLPQREVEVEPKYYEGPESPFSRDNPFQSGSSPPAVTSSKSGDRRRTTVGRPRDDDRPKSRDARRMTEDYRSTTRRENDPPIRSSARRADPPAPAVKIEDDALSPGEEFAPEEQLELEREQISNNTVAIRPKKRKQKASGVAKAAPWSVFVAILGGVATVWRQEKVNVGYCGVGQPSTSLAGVEIPEWASALQPQCEPCPQHAYCYPNLETVCEPDFVLTPHPLSLNGLVPLPPTCEPDSEKVRKIKQVADFVVEKELREHNAKYECGEVKKPEILEEELKATVSAKRSKRMTDEEFNDIWDSALGEAMGREEVTTKMDGGRRLIRSTSLARIPLSCAVRRSLLGALRQHLPKLVALIMLSLSGVYGRHALTTRRSTSTRAKQLARLTLDKLATQASFHAEDPISFPEPWVSMVALRDDVLREEFSAKERTRLWDVVKGLVEGNANVRSMVREGRTGEVSRVWEWIGAIERLESPESGRRSSKRFSLGGPGRVVGSPDGRLTDVSGIEDGTDERTPEMKEKNHSRWSEGGGAYY